MAQSPILLLSLAAILLTQGASIAQAYDPADDNVCHITLKGKSSSLNRLCGMEPPVKMIDLSIDRDGDGISDELVAAMQDYWNKSDNDRSTDQTAIAKKFQARLPYSDHVRKLYAQYYASQSYTGAHEYYAISRVSSFISTRQELEKDPTYRTVQAAIKKVEERQGRPLYPFSRPF